MEQSSAQREVTHLLRPDPDLFLQLAQRCRSQTFQLVRLDAPTDPRPLPREPGTVRSPAQEQAPVTHEEQDERVDGEAVRALSSVHRTFAPLATPREQRPVPVSILTAV
jgi:hypothetical protein